MSQTSLCKWKNGSARTPDLAAIVAAAADPTIPTIFRYLASASAGAPAVQPKPGDHAHRG